MRFASVRPAAAAVLAAGFLFHSASPAAALFGFGKKAAPAPVPVAAVGSLQGKASYQAKGAAASTPLAAGQRLMPGDTLRTEKGSSVIIAFSDGSKVQIGESAVFAVETLEPKKISMKINVGVLEAWVAKMKGRRFQTRSPTAVASVRGTEYRMLVDLRGGTTLDLFGGSLDLSNNLGQSVAVDPGNRIMADTGGNLTKPEPIPDNAPPPTPEPTVAIPEETPPAADTGKKEEPAKEEGGEKKEEPAGEPAGETQGEPTGEPTKTDGTGDAPPPPPPNPNQDTQNASPSTP